MKKYSKIAIIGSYPPPYGGISVHVQRTIDYLNDEEFILYNTASSNYSNSIRFSGKKIIIIIISFLFKKFRLIHHHTPSKKARLLLCFLGFFKRNIFLHIHGASLEDNFMDKSVSSFFLKKTLKNVNIIADNSRILNLVKPYNPRNIYQIDAFLPPVYKEKTFASFAHQVPPPKAKILISMVGWFKEYRNTDLYGFDLALEALSKLRNEHHLDVAIVASVSGITNDFLYNQFIKKRSELCLENYLFLITDELEEIWPLYLMTDIFIRPSISDGSSVALLEAMWFEAKTIVSDSVPRPEGVILFNDRDANDLVNKILLVVEGGYPSKTERVKKIKNKKFESKLIKEIYKIER